MARSLDPREINEVIFAVRTGRPAKEIDEYDELTLWALLTETKTAKDEWEKIRVEAQSAQKHWTEPIEITETTGDPLIDKWEQEIARGRVPDLDEEL